MSHGVRGPIAKTIDCSNKLASSKQQVRDWSCPLLGSYTTTDSWLNRKLRRGLKVGEAGLYVLKHDNKRQSIFITCARLSTQAKQLDDATSNIPALKSHQQILAVVFSDSIAPQLFCCMLSSTIHNIASKQPTKPIRSVSPTKVLAPPVYCAGIVDVAE